MKTECDVRLMRSDLDVKLRNLKRDCVELGINTIESQLVFAVIEEKIKLLDEILETQDNSCFG